MTIAHKDIPDSQLHEPKGASSATVDSLYIANGLGSGAWAKVTEKQINRSDKTKNIFGWNDIADSLYTSGSPLAIASGVRTKLTNNGLAAQTDTTRLGSLWNTGTNTFVIDDLNAMYDIRIAMRVKAAAAAGTPYTLKMEIESSSGALVILARDNYIKGGSYENCITLTTNIYMGSAINGSSLSIYLTPDTNITLYNIGFVIQRTYAEKNY